MSIKKFKKEDALPGSLSKYAKNVKGKIPFKKIREMAWEEVVREKERKRKKIKKDPAMEIIGLGGSEKGNLSYEHDRYLIKYSSKKNDIPQKYN